MFGSSLHNVFSFNFLIFFFLQFFLLFDISAPNQFLLYFQFELLSEDMVPQFNSCSDYQSGLLVPACFGFPAF